MTPLPDPASARWDWLMLAVMTATLASLARWVIAQPAVARSRYGPLLSAIVASPWLTQPLRCLHAVGIPACAIYWQHALSAKGLGLKALPLVGQAASRGLQVAPGLDAWVRDIGALGYLVPAVAGLVMLGDRAARKWYGSALAGSRRRSWSNALREGIIHQVRWALYREPFVFVWGVSVGSWLGTLPVLVEALVSPTFWESLRSGRSDRARATVVRAGFLISSVLIYGATQNLWIAIALNILLEWLVLSGPPNGSVDDA